MYLFNAFNKFKGRNNINANLKCSDAKPHCLKKRWFFKNSKNLVHTF